jgi:cysteine desulfurase
MSEHLVYLDNNATTPVDPAVAEKMAAFLREQFGNPSSLYPIGRKAKEALTESREAVAGFLGAHRSEITFTGSGTEADNLAIQGILEAHPDKTEIVTSTIEHPAILETARALEKKGIAVRYAPVDGTGLVDLDFIRSAVTPRTALVSVMHANNELGTIQPIEEIARIAHDKGAVFHADAVQSFGKIPIDVDRLGVDLLTVSAHKIYGPKGVGALYVRRGTDIFPFIHGGRQERGLRAGTENTSGIVGFGEAVRVLGERMKKDKDRIEKLAERLKAGIESRVPKVRFNGHPERRVKSTLNFAFPGLEAEAILLALATKGISVSTGSACSADAEEVSHVLLAIGLRPEIARSCIRMSLGRFNTDEDVATVLAELPEIIDKLRKISSFDPAE